MKICDKYLIDNALNFESKLYLNKETIKLLRKIQNTLNSNPTYTFRTKEISKEIRDIWTCILQDSIHNLKCCDYREFSHWSGDKVCFDKERDINNDYTFGLENLKKYFDEFTGFEKVLYGVDGNYRDHVIHVFRVWLLGIAVLYNKFSDISISVEDIDSDKLIPDKPLVCDEEAISMWAIIALCHDLGYPLEKAEKINESVEKMYRHLGKMNIQRFNAAFQHEHQFLNKFILDFISSKIEYDKDNIKSIELLADEFDEFSKNNSLEDYKKVKPHFIDEKHFRTVVQAKYYIKFAKSLEIYSHGIISCSILFKSLFYFLESDFNIQEKPRLSFEDARQFCIRKEILRSIAAHTCPEVYHLKPNTFSFLLILCDELQEWGRPRFDEMQTDFEMNDKEITIFKFTKKEVEFTIEYKKDILDKDLPEKIARKLFKRWHAILRSAVFDIDREFSLEFILIINKTRFIFHYEGNSLVAKQNDSNFDIYRLDEKD